MERLRQKDAEAGDVRESVSDAQKAEIAEVRSRAEARIAELKILHQSKVLGIFDPEAHALVDAEFRRDIQRVGGGPRGEDRQDSRRRRDDRAPPAQWMDRHRRLGARQPGLVDGVQARQSPRSGAAAASRRPHRSRPRRSLLRAVTPSPASSKPRESTEAPPAPAPEPAPAAPAAGPLLRVIGDVAGADVFIDRTFVGKTPFETREVTSGGHQINVSAEGFDGMSRHVEVAADAPTEVTFSLKAVVLDSVVQVVHKHRLGSCEGAPVRRPCRPSLRAHQRRRRVSCAAGGARDAGRGLPGEDAAAEAQGRQELHLHDQGRQRRPVVRVPPRRREGAQEAGRRRVMHETAAVRRGALAGVGGCLCIAAGIILTAPRGVVIAAGARRALGPRRATAALPMPSWSDVGIAPARLATGRGSRDRGLGSRRGSTPARARASARTCWPHPPPAHRRPTWSPPRRPSSSGPSHLVDGHRRCR